MSSSLKIAGIVCLSMLGENAAFTLSSTPAARLPTATRSAISSSTRPPRLVSLRMQQQQVETKDLEAKSDLSPKIDLSDDQESTLSATVSEKAISEVQLSSAQVRDDVAAKRSKMSGASSRKREENEFAATALQFGALKAGSPLLQSQLVGNKGFDPLNLAKDDGLLRQYREAEIKHGRLAMLASVGWVASELFHPALSSFLNKPSLLAKTAAGVQEKAPSVLNGGLEQVPAWTWGVLFIASGVVEVARMLSISSEPQTFTPGALGFDPLNFYGLADAKEKEALQLKELNNGRLAMIGIAAFAAKEYMYDAAIVNQSPELFTKGPLSLAVSIPALLLQYTGLFSCQTGLTYCAQGDTDVIKAIMSTSDAGVAEQAEYINSIMSTSLFL